jgi:hypothetical protein
MSNENSDKNKNLKVYQRARRATRVKIGFFYHLAAYTAVNLLLLAINLVVSPGIFWCIFPAIFWGIGIAIHGLSVVLFGLGVRDRMIDREVAKETGK